MPCLATGSTITVAFSAPITSATYPAGATVSPEGGNTITFSADSLEPNPTDFSVMLDTTDVASGTSVVSYVAYSDTQENSPDMSSLMALLSSVRECNEDDAAGATVVGDHEGAAAGAMAEEDHEDAADATMAEERHEDAAADTMVGDDAAGGAMAEEGMGVVSVSRRLQEEEEGEEAFDCSPCEDLSEGQIEALANYDDEGVKEIVCDPTCLDGVTDPLHCNCEFLHELHE